MMRPTEKRRSKSGNGASPGPRGKNKSSIPERTANWPGVPGRTQPRDRSNGVKKLKIHPKSEGL